MVTLDTLSTKSNNLISSRKSLKRKLFSLQELKLQIKQQKSSFKVLKMSQNKTRKYKNSDNLIKKFKPKLTNFVNN